MSLRLERDAMNAEWMNGMTKELFRSSNGCTLAEVNERADAANTRLKASIELLAEAEAVVRPLQLDMEIAWSSKENAEYLRKLWWREFEASQKQPND